MSLIIKKTTLLKWVIIINLFVFSCIAHAQVSFVVYQVKGDAFYLTGKNKVPLKIGQSIENNGFIITGANGQATLVSSTYCSASLKAAGKYSYDQIKKLCIDPSTDISTSYFKHMWDQVTSSKNTPESDHRNNMNIKGAVVRGCPGIKFPIWVDTVRYFSGDLIFKWLTGGGNITSNFLVFESEDAESTLLSMPCTGDSVQLAEVVRKINKPGNYFWTVGVNNKMDCPKHYIEFWEKTKFDKFCNDYLSNFKSMNISVAEKNNILGYYLEQHRFYADAIRYYKSALKLDPKNELYRKSIDDFSKNY